ncbi:TCR/Tet family MFS transporter [Arenibaculum pallidiluteum]|uniref:TCR/Tet family MFS transporter n=1 Tax=Arenibaculum pallidiluteum TaxID=2812559 RepID=UPI001A96B375|nr:TCR/Tet family MFS transporter [Arenibaculum pallidiluteum]
MAAPSAAGPRRAALAFIFVTIVLDVLALGIIVPVLPRLVVEMTGDTVSGAEMFGLFGTAWAVMQFLASPVLGALSDRFGRRRVLLLSSFGLGLDYVLMALAPTLGWLFLGRVISGVTAAGFATAGAYIADVTPPERRAASFGLLGAAFGLGFVLGPAAGGVLGGIDPRLPFWAAAGLTLLNAAYGFFILPESLPREQRAAFSWRRANPVGALGLLRGHPGLLGIAAVVFLYNLAHEALPNVFVLYTGYRYGWDETRIGLTLAAVGVFSAIVQGGLVRVAVARLGERRTLILGLSCGALGMAAFGAAATATMFWAAIPALALWGLSGPAAQGLMSRRVEPGEQGRLQGALTALHALAGLAGPGLFTLAFARGIDEAGAQVPGAPFLLAALLLGASAALAWLIAGRSRG